VRALVRSVLVAALIVPAACGSGSAPPPPPELLRPAWQEQRLPVPPGPAGRLAVRDATTCGSHWYVVGAVIGPDDSTRPAAWTSPDGQRWTSLAFRPRTFYGEQAVLYTAACHGDAFAAVGAKSGGAHGNPRVTTWYQRDDGVMDEVLAAFSQYGGPTAGNVSRIAAGPEGWLIAGNRNNGAAVWLSPDAKGFVLLAGVPGLANDPDVRTTAVDALGRPDGWVLVGAYQRVDRIDRDPAAWTSEDGRTWTRVEVAGTDGYEEMQRVVDRGSELVAVGLAGPAFGAWRGTGGSWRPAGQFGSTGGSGTAIVRSAAAAAGEVFAAASDGTAFGLWSSADAGQTWRGVVLPGAAPAGSDRSAAIAGAGDLLVLVVDDGQTGKVWSTKIAPG